MNRTLAERVRSLFSQTKLPNSFWGEALSTYVYLLNLKPCVPWSLMYQTNFGHVKLFLIILCVSLDVRHLCIFLKMRNQRLMRRLGSVYLLGMVKSNLVINLDLVQKKIV